jgi:hypothetical protein
MSDFGISRGCPSGAKLIAGYLKVDLEYIEMYDISFSLPILRIFGVT